MMFKELLENWNSPFDNNFIINDNTSIYPINEDNIEGIKILINNCIKSGTLTNSNVSIATVDPSLWLGQVLDRNWKFISFVTTLPTFNYYKIENGHISSKNYSVETVEFNSEADLDDFFQKGKWSKLVIHNLIKYVNLSNLRTSFRIRFADLSEKYEVRDKKISSILDNGTGHN